MKSQPGASRAGMEASPRSSPRTPARPVTARHEPGRDGSGVVASVVYTGFVSHSPARAGQGWKHHRHVQRRRRPAPVTARREPGRDGSHTGRRESSQPHRVSQPGASRAGMEAGARRRSSPGRPTSQPGASRAGMEARRRSRCRRRGRRVTARREPGRDGSTFGSSAATSATAVTARREPGRDGSIAYRLNQPLLGGGHSPARAGQGWKLDPTLHVRGDRARHSPARAGQGWKHDSSPFRRRMANRHSPARAGQGWKRGGPRRRTAASRRHSPARAGQGWKHHSAGLRRAAVARSQPGASRAGMEAAGRRPMIPMRR